MTASSWTFVKKPMAGDIDVMEERCVRCRRRLYMVPPATDRRCRGCDELGIDCYCPALPPDPVSS